MKHFLIIILLFNCLFSLKGKNQFSPNSQLTDRIEIINDSISRGVGKNLLPELLNLRDSLESSPIFDGYNYVHVVWCINEIYFTQQDLKNVRNSIDVAFDLFEKKGQKDNPCVRTLYMNRGALWHYLENNIEAKKDLLYAKELYERTNDISDEYAECLMNISTMLSSDEGVLDLVNSKLYLEEALDILDTYYNERNISKDIVYYHYLNDLATLYFKLGDISTARHFYEEIITNTQDSDESYDKLREISISNLSYILFQEGKYNDASNIAINAIKDVKDFRIKDWLYQTIILSLNQVNDANVDDWLAQYNKYARTHVSEIFSTFTEREREAYWTNQSQGLLYANNMVANKVNSPSSLIMAYDNLLYTKTLLLKSNSLLPKIINKSGSPGLINCYSEISSLKDKLNDKNMSQDSIIHYQTIINNLEKHLICSIPNFGEKLNDEIPTYNAVRTVLGKNDVAIEFTIIPDIGKKPYKYYYGALIARSEYSTPRLVKICEMDSLDDMMDCNYSKLWADHIYSLKNDSIYCLLWKPIEMYLHKGDNIYYSPSGEINKLNLTALSNGKKRLMELYNIRKVTTTGNIPSIKLNEKTDYHSALLYGGIDYSTSPEEMANESGLIKNSFADFLATRSINERGNWMNLVATAYEVSQIESVLKNFNVNTLLVSGKAANEESFKSLSGRAPEILHIATHGFFLPEPKKRKSPFFNNIVSFTQKNESLFYSGLLFAGANNTWNGVNIQPEVEDGILTANEVSRVDLSKCKLVVLSACNTGLGTVDMVDGVFGLQRGFKQAGVGSIIMSLWKVDDQATAELMIAFYQFLNKGHNTHEALELAKKKLIKDKRFSDPYYWAAFVVLD